MTDVRRNYRVTCPACGRAFLLQDRAAVDAPPGVRSQCPKCGEWHVYQRSEIGVVDSAAPFRFKRSVSLDFPSKPWVSEDTAYDWMWTPEYPPHDPRRVRLFSPDGTDFLDVPVTLLEQDL